MGVYLTRRTKRRRRGVRVGDIVFARQTGAGLREEQDIRRATRFDDTHDAKNAAKVAATFDPDAWTVRTDGEVL